VIEFVVDDYSNNCFLAAKGAKTQLMAKTADDRPLLDLKGFSVTIATDINDLPTASPHGSYSEHDSRNLGFATDPNATRGTAAAHPDRGRRYLALPRKDTAPGGGRRGCSQRSISARS